MLNAMVPYVYLPNTSSMLGYMNFTGGVVQLMVLRQLCIQGENCSVNHFSVNLPTLEDCL
jgi:hypothetical protein